jgi:hypothetical protein
MVRFNRKRGDEIMSRKSDDDEIEGGVWYSLPNLGKLYTAKEVAEEMNTTEDWVRQHRDELGGKKIGGKCFFPEKELENALQRQEKKQMGSRVQEQTAWNQETTTIRDQEHSKTVGIGYEKRISKRSHKAKDPYGILPQ